MFFIIATAADLLSQEVKHAVIPTGQRRTFSLYTCLKEMFSTSVASHGGKLVWHQGIWTDLDGTGRQWAQDVDGREGHISQGPKYGMALLSEKWNGFCFAGKESVRNRSGQVRQGVLVFPASNRKHHGRCYAWSSLMAFVFPRLTYVFLFFLLRGSLFIVMGLPRSFEPMDAASLGADGRVWK